MRRALAAWLSLRHRGLAFAAAGAFVWSVGSSLWVYPHSLSYFNELAGGPKHLIHSNVDWGQDLLFLKRWLDEHPEARPLKLAYFGYFDPIHADIEYSAPEPMAATDPILAGEGDSPILLPGHRKIGTVPAVSDERRIPPGWYAISVNFVRGFPYQIYKGDGTRGFLPQGALAAFQNLEPVATAGYSIYIYHVGPHE
jgi:hypothetical protein